MFFHPSNEIGPVHYSNFGRVMTKFLYSSGAFWEYTVLCVLTNHYSRRPLGSKCRVNPQTEESSLLSIIYSNGLWRKVSWSQFSVDVHSPVGELQYKANMKRYLGLVSSYSLHSSEVYRRIYSQSFFVWLSMSLTMFWCCCQWRFVLWWCYEEHVSVVQNSEYLK